jgi:peptidyl-prolyl cis-trans isomerase C
VKRILLALILLSFPTVAQAAEDKLIARVGGVEIRQSDLDLAETEIGAELSRLPAPEKQEILARYVMDTQMMANQAKKEGLDKSPEFAKRVAYYQRRAYRDAYFEHAVRSKVSDAEAKAIYDERIGSQKPETEVRARHILVETEAEARDIVEQLNRGADFATLAAEKSKGPSKDQGGDLGYFTRGRMVKEFDEVAFKLKKGEISKPVQTRFGWHVLRLDDRREKKNPPFSTFKNMIISQLVRDKAQEVIEGMRKQADIKVIDKDLAAILKDE